MSDMDQEALDTAIANRCKDLIGVITLTTWKYLRRGLFVTHKLTIATQLTFKVLIKDGLLDKDMVDFLIMADFIECERPATLWWVPMAAWWRIKFISKFSQFKDFHCEVVDQYKSKDEFMKFYEGPVIPYYIKGYTIKCGSYRYKWLNPFFEE